MSNPGNLHLAIVLSLNNAMGAGLASARASLNGLSGAVNRLRQNWTSLHSLAAGAGVGLSLYAPVEAFAAQEDALARLDSTLMRAGGHLDAMTKPMKELAVLLGNELPG